MEEITIKALTDFSKALKERYKTKKLRFKHKKDNHYLLSCAHVG